MAPQAEALNCTASELMFEFGADGVHGCRTKVQHLQRFGCGTSGGFRG